MLSTMKVGIAAALAVLGIVAGATAPSAIAGTPPSPPPRHPAAQRRRPRRRQQRRTERWRRPASSHLALAIVAAFAAPERGGEATTKGARMNAPDSTYTNGRYELPRSGRGVLVLADPPEAGWRMRVPTDEPATAEADPIDGTAVNQGFIGGANPVSGPFLGRPACAVPDTSVGRVQRCAPSSTSDSAGRTCSNFGIGRGLSRSAAKSWSRSTPPESTR